MVFTSFFSKSSACLDRLYSVVWVVKKQNYTCKFPLTGSCLHAAQARIQPLAVAADSKGMIFPSAIKELMGKIHVQGSHLRSKTIKWFGDQNRFLRKKKNTISHIISDHTRYFPENPKKVEYKWISVHSLMRKQNLQFSLLSIIKLLSVTSFY